MDYAEIELQTLVLLAEIAQGSTSYTDAQVADGIQWAQEQTSHLLGLTYTESVLAITGVTGATGAMQTGVLIPADAIKVTRLQVWDNTMNDLVGS